MATWNPHSPKDWTRAFGLVAVPYFGRSRLGVPEGDHRMMQDGEAASFALHITPPNSVLNSQLPLGWGWSAHVRHSVVLDVTTGMAVIHRWDDAGYKENRDISTEKEANRFISDLESYKSGPSATDVITRTLHTFSVLRTAIEERAGSSLDVIQAFNASLLLAEQWRDNPTLVPDIKLADLVDVLHADGHAGFARGVVSEEARRYPIGEFARFLLEFDPIDSPYLLDADLLIRHASGRLYQELHRQLAVAPQRIRQPTLFETPLPTNPGGPRRPAPGFVHHTPPWLARALAEVSLEYVLAKKKETLDVLDPACGSGVFLIEIAREMSRFYAGSLNLRGMDLSPEAGVMTEFCVGEAGRDLSNISVTQSNRSGVNSLSEFDWGTPDVIVMNPPFKAWKDLDEANKGIVRQSLGGDMAGRPDLYLAFLVRAAAALKDGGVLASVVPASFFSVKTADKVRLRLGSGKFRVRLLGLFQGFETFDGTLVEVGILIIEKCHADAPIRTIIANHGKAEKSVRLLRTVPNIGEVKRDGIEISTMPASSLNKEGWVLHRARDIRFAEELCSSTSTRVRDLFTVRLGIRGLGGRKHRKILLLSEETYHRLITTDFEQAFFRPVADRIKKGRIRPSGYVFYPYGEDGQLLLTTEEDVATAVPGFFREVLLPAKGTLEGRGSLNRKPNRSPSRNWWEPSEPVKTWLAAKSPRILSQEFGRRGNFAYDALGQYAVAAGHAWIWKRGNAQSDMLLAYLAILNSKTFDRLLRIYSPQLQGGQYRLESRYIYKVPLPDLSSRYEELAVMGGRINTGELYDQDDLNEAVRHAYKPTPLTESPEDLAKRFRALRDRWTEETSHFGFAGRMARHPAYQEIIRMGEKAIPLLLGELKRTPDHWFIALHEITKENPVPKKSEGKIKEMAKAWLLWGKNKGYIP